MSAVGTTVWLVQVTEQQGVPDDVDPTLTGYHPHASEQGAQAGLRETLLEMGVEVITKPKFDAETGLQSGSFNVDGRFISFVVAPLRVNE